MSLLRRRQRPKTSAAALKAESASHPPSDAERSSVPLPGPQEPIAAVPPPAPPETAVEVLPRPPAAPLARPEDVRPHFGPRQVLEYALSDVAPNTRRAYSKDVRLFAQWLGTTDEAAVGHLIGHGRGAANALVVDWLNSMREAGLTTATRARRVNALAAVVRAARRLELVEWALEVRRPKVTRYKDTRGATREQARHLLSRCAGDTLKDSRNRAMLLMVLTMGLRRSELAAVRRGHFLDNGRLRVVGKGGKVVDALIPEETRRALERWLTTWKDRNPEAPPDDVVFRSLNPRTYGQPLTSRGVYDALSAIGAAAGFKIWPHGLRHTAITVGLEESDGNVRAAASFGRHSDPKTTMEYDDNRRDAGGAIATRLGQVFGEEKDK